MLAQMGDDRTKDKENLEAIFAGVDVNETGKTYKIYTHI
jgi:hypothetical protein